MESFLGYYYIVMVKLANIRKDIMKYYYEVEHPWTTKDYHCVNVVFYNEDHIPSWDYTFYDLQQFLDEENDEEYHSVELKFDPITIKFPCVCIK
jgi:phage pi2 protein 07